MYRHAVTIFSAVLVLLVIALPAAAADNNLQATLKAYLLAQTADIDGQVSIQITMPDVRMSPCRTPQPFLPRRDTHLAGAITVGVKCPGDRPQTRYFRAYIGIVSSYFVAAHLLQTGTAITAPDLKRVSGDITRLPPGVITDPSRLLGTITARRIPQGIPLTKNMVYRQKAIERGDRVKIVIQGRGFAIRTTGQALGSAALGEQIRVRTQQGNVVTGTTQRNNTVVIRQ